MKKISWMMALIMVLNIVLPSGFFGVNVQAATTNSQIQLMSSTTNMLSPLGSGDSPIKMTSGQPDIAMWFEWNAGGVDETTELSYVNNIGQKIVFNVKNNGDYYDVTYNIYKPDGTTPAYTISDAYTVQTQKITPPGAVPYTKYSNAAGNVQVVQTGIDRPTFKVTKGTGFTFTYGGRKNSFLIDNSGRVNYYDEKMEKGYIYNATVEYKKADGITVDDYSIQVSNGIDTTTFKNEPFANEDKYRKDIVGINEWDDPNNLDKQWDSTESWSTDDDKWPANDEEAKGLDISFDIPKIWDGSKFVTADNVKLKYTMTDNSTNKLITSTFTYNAGSISGETAAGADIGYSATAGNVKMTMKGLDAGIIYSLPKIDIVSYNGQENGKSINFTAKTTNVQNVRVYTFPHYYITNRDGILYLEVVPYKNTVGEYLLRTGIPLKPSVTQKVENNKTTLISFPLSQKIGDGDTTQYRIDFKENGVFSEEEMNQSSDELYPNIPKSQTLQYKAGEAKGGITTPKNFTITNDELTQKYDASNNIVQNEAELALGLKWDMGTKADIDKMLSTADKVEIIYNVDYSKEFSESPDNDELINFSQIIVELTKDSSGNVLATWRGGDGTYDDAKANKPNGFNEDKEANYVIEQSTPVPLNTRYNSAFDESAYYIEVNMIERVGDKDKISDLEKPEEIWFKYEGIYFLSVQPTKVTIDGVEDKSSYSHSQFAPLTLDDIGNIAVPTPQNLEIINTITETTDMGYSTQEVSMELEWILSGQLMDDYLMSLYRRDLIDTAEEVKDLGIKAYFDVYVSQDATVLQNNVRSKKTITERRNNSKPVPYTAPTDNTTPRIYMRSLNGGDVVPVTPNGKRGIDVLRNNEVVRIERIELTDEQITQYINAQTTTEHKLVIDGLDVNTEYFAFIDLVVEHPNRADEFDGDSEKYLVEWSDPTNVVGTTTGDAIDILNPNDIQPDAPNLYEIETGVNYSKLGWLPITVADPATGYNQDVEYEILRLRGTPMDKKYLDNRDALVVFYEKYLTGIPTASRQSLLTDGNQLLKYNDSATSTGVVASGFEYLRTNKEIQFTDNTLDSNKVYYYYVRTVREITENSDSTNVKKLYSVWSLVAVTTKATAAPTGLRVIEEYAKNYDPYTQVPLEFFAPVNASSVGVDINFELSIKKDGEEWSTPTTIAPSSMVMQAVAGKNLTRFEFVARGLEPGTTYSFKVRQKNADGTYSIYSNVVKWKTEVDPDEYDDGEDIDDWVDYIKGLIEELINDDYWVINDSTNSFDVVYREEKFDGIIAGNNSSNLTLLPAKSDKANNYYIPINAYNKLNAKNIGLTINYENTTITLSNDAISTTHPKMVEMIKNIDQDKIDDYYIELSVIPKKGVSVFGEPSATDDITYSIKLVGYDKTIAYWEKDVYKQMLVALDNKENTQKINDIIEELVKDDKTNEQIIAEINAYILSKRSDIISYIDKDFRNNVDNNRIVDISDVEKDVIYSINNVGSTIAKGYKLENNMWAPQKVINFGNSYTFKSKSDGEFIFTGIVINIQGMDGVPNQENIKDMIIKNDVYSTIATNGTVDMNQTVTNDTALKVVADMLGMTYDEVSTQFINNGYTINARNKNNKLTQQDSVYMCMKLYEQLTNTSVNSYTIKNYSHLQKVKNSGVKAEYVNSIEVAYEMGIYTGDVSPTTNVNMQQFLDTVYNVKRLSGK